MRYVTNNRSLETLTPDDFRSARGTQFRMAGGPVGGPSMSLDIELVDVAEDPPRAASAPRSPFSVLFYGPLEPVMPQGIYHLENDDFGALELFIVPLGPSEPDAAGQAGTAMRYEAVFG